jgi:hypothetical protein
VWYRPVLKLFRDLLMTRADDSLGRVLDTPSRAPMYWWSMILPWPAE